MRQFHSGKRDRSIRERLEASHGRTPSLDRTVVLFDDVVEVLAGSSFHFAPDWMLSPQSPQRASARHMAIDGDLPRSTWVRSERLAGERLRRGDAALRSQQEVDRLALLVDGAVQIVPAASNWNVGFIHTP